MDPAAGAPSPDSTAARKDVGRRSDGSELREQAAAVAPEQRRRWSTCAAKTSMRCRFIVMANMHRVPIGGKWLVRAPLWLSFVFTDKCDTAGRTPSTNKKWWLASSYPGEKVHKIGLISITMTGPQPFLARPETPLRKTPAKMGGLQPVWLRSPRSVGRPLSNFVLMPTFKFSRKPWGRLGGGRGPSKGETRPV